MNVLFSISPHTFYPVFLSGRISKTKKIPSIYETDNIDRYEVKSLVFLKNFFEKSVEVLEELPITGNVFGLTKLVNYLQVIP